MKKNKKPKYGWYTDPQNSNLNRYWDGEQWTGATRLKLIRTVDGGYAGIVSEQSAEEKERYTIARKRIPSLVNEE
jgi:hypothetical protein